jgi:uncharacterized protein with PQ loop repeat
MIEPLTAAAVQESIGWAGAVLLAFCGLPQAVQSWRTRSSAGVSWGFLGMWGVGEILTLAYVAPMSEWPLIVNYSANIVFVAVIAFFKLPRR